MAAGVEERAALVKKMEKLHLDVRLADERAKRKEDMLQLEINRIQVGCYWLLLVVAAVASFLTQCAFQGELRLERTKMTNLEMQLEEKRRSMEQVQEALERKREKKKKWKAAQRECGELLQCGGNMEWDMNSDGNPVILAPYPRSFVLQMRRMPSVTTSRPCWTKSLLL